MMKYLSQDISLQLDVNRCVGCGMCEIVCPHGVFVVEKKKARILDREACIECGACARNCPVDALAVVSGVGCAEAIINGLLTGKEACCGSGECCSSSSPSRKNGCTNIFTTEKEREMEEKTIKLEVFDPPMCCSSGVCGPNVDKKLVQFGATLEWLRSQGVEVKRYNPTQQYEEFVCNTTVVDAINEHPDCLPLILVNGEIVSRGGYPDKAELAVMVGILNESMPKGEKV